MNITFIILGVLAVVAIWAIATYNKLIAIRVRVKEAWADIDIQLKRRYDLIPNLVNTVKGYAKHEEGTFEKVTKARTAAMSAQGAHDQAQAENMLTGALKSVFALSENYPELKANESFLELQKELSDTENKIMSARRFFNTLVRDLNTTIATVPTNIIANIFKFTVAEYFDLDSDTKARENVEVKF
ncbi:MAG: LemA family protein [bacterium]|nr:LemA family protein [bacterium]